MIKLHSNVFYFQLVWCVFWCCVHVAWLSYLYEHQRWRYIEYPIFGEYTHVSIEYGSLLIITISGFLYDIRKTRYALIAVIITIFAQTLVPQYGRSNIHCFLVIQILHMFNKKTIFISGGTGSFGSRLVDIIIKSF